MNFIRKKPAGPLDELTQLYNDTCNRTIQNIAFEEKGDYKAAVQGWKGLHTNVLYKMDVINKSFSPSTYSADELYLREGIEQLDEKGLEHYDRVCRLYSEYDTEVRPQRLPYSSAYSVPTLRGSSPHNFSVRKQQTQEQQKPRLLKTLRAEKPHKFSSAQSSSNKPSEVSRVAANAMYKTTTNTKQSNWAPSKSLSNTSALSSPRQSEDLIDIFDQSFEDDLMDNDVQTQKRNEALQQLEATGLQSRLARSKSQDLNFPDFEKLDINITSPKKSSESPKRNSSNFLPSLDSSLSSRPPIPKTTPLVTQQPKPSPPAHTPQIKRLGLPTADNPKSASTSRLPSTNRNIPVKSTGSLTTSTKPSIKPTASSRPQATSRPSAAPRTTTTKPPVRPSTSAQGSRPPVQGAKPTPRPGVRPKPTGSAASAAASRTTAKKPIATKPPAKAPAKAPVRRTAVNNSSAAASRQRSESPIGTETKDTETINSQSSEEGVAEELELSEKEVREKMEDQIIEGIRGIDPGAAKQIFNEIVVRGDEVHWDDIAGLETAKNSLKETVVYPFLRPDLFSGLREPARGMLLFGPPGTGKTMLARAVATESKSTFFSISASSLTSKYLGESEKLVRALFLLARELSPSIIFVDEIDSLLSSRNENGENESSRRIKNEFLIQWSELTHAAAGRDHGEDLQRVLVLAATNLPWAIDEAARRRFVRRQYIPLPEGETRLAQIIKLLAHQKHTMDEKDQWKLVELTEGYSGSDITALAKDAAMGPLRSLGDKLLSTTRDDIRPIELKDFENSLKYIKPSVSRENLKEFDEWAAKFGSSGV